MANEATGRILLFILVIGLLVGVVFLQIYLSKRANKWLGLILPAVIFSISLINVMNMAVFFQPIFTETTFVNGELVTIIADAGERRAIPGAVGGIIYFFILTNIPTIILLVIYKVVRGKQNRNRDVEKMSVQDL
ncbi:MAG: hypothetical protein FWB74_05715 [Defluviitaleaceae bacterium]|nr:hypothetical protein [Defluviitaleaceae bacterium]